MLKKLAQTLLNFFEYAIKCCSIFSYILAIFPKNKTISLSSKSHSSKLHSFFKILILLISRYNKASAVFFKKVRFYDAKDKFFLLTFPSSYIRQSFSTSSGGINEVAGKSRVKVDHLFLTACIFFESAPALLKAAPFNTVRVFAASIKLRSCW